MPTDTAHEVETHASGLMDKMGAMMTDAVEAVQDFAADVMGHDADEEAGVATPEDDVEAMDDDEDDMGDVDSEEADVEDADETEEA